jgi:hypothetical protein
MNRLMNNTTSGGYRYHGLLRHTRQHGMLSQVALFIALEGIQKTAQGVQR